MHEPSSLEGPLLVLIFEAVDKSLKAWKGLLLDSTSLLLNLKRVYNHNGAGRNHLLMLYRSFE